MGFGVFMVHSSMFSPQIQREKGKVGKVSPNGLAHVYLSANYHYMFLMSIGKGRVRGRGRGWEGVRELTLFLRIWSMGLGNPMSELTLTPLHIRL